MFRRLVPPVLLALACVLVLGAAAPAANALSRDAQLRQNLRLLQVYIERTSAKNGFSFAPVAAVKRGGGLIAPVWPKNPWTGEPMAPGTGRGSYAYTVDDSHVSYTLTGWLSGGRFRLTGRAPSWLQAERDAAATDLSNAQGALATAQAELEVAHQQVLDAQADAAAAQAAVAPSRATAARNGLAMIQEVARNLAKGIGAPPTGATLTYENLHSSWPGWPVSAFDGQPMHQGTQPGDFTYTPGADGSWTFVAHLTSGDFTLTQDAYDWAAARDAQTIVGATFISYGLELRAIMYNDTYPATLSSSTIDTIDPWPTNPYTNQPMSDGMTKGNYHYSTTMSGYTLVATLADGSTYDVAAWTQPQFAPLMRLRVSLKDKAAEGYAQVLKDYVDEWKLAHAGVLPTADQMSAAGAVGAAHTWWPLNPWTMQPMAQGATTGCFEYTPGDDGAFTIVLHQSALPMVYGDPSTAFAATYTAQ